MPFQMRGLIRVVLAATLSVALFILATGTVSRAQGGGSLSSYNSGHASVQYPAGWIALHPSADSEVASYKSLDDVAEFHLYSYANDSRKAAQAVQGILDQNTSDTTFKLIAPSAPAQVANASDSAGTEYVHTISDGSLQHFYQRVAVAGGNWSQLELKITDNQLSQYQTQVYQILNSFQLVP